MVLHKSARVDGTSHAPRLVVEDGAVFTGRIEMGPVKHAKIERSVPPTKDASPAKI